ncbi:unnamed protein product, partial [Gongylonema pulchrum]|uniref:SERPIN domain-containing protein n=1 Tax=Gongylonema pulchrum TaxID=637853 RepID=A0A183EEP3_9BILA
MSQKDLITVAVIYFLTHVGGSEPVFSLQSEPNQWFYLGDMKTQLDTNRLIVAIKLMLRRGANVTFNETVNGQYKFQVQATQDSFQTTTVVNAAILTFTTKGGDIPDVTQATAAATTTIAADIKTAVSTTSQFPKLESTTNSAGQNDVNSDGISNNVTENAEVTAQTSEQINNNSVDAEASTEKSKITETTLPSGIAKGVAWQKASVGSFQKPLLDGRQRELITDKVWIKEYTTGMLRPLEGSKMVKNTSVPLSDTQDENENLADLARTDVAGVDEILTDPMAVAVNAPINKTAAEIVSSPVLREMEEATTFMNVFKMGPSSTDMKGILLESSVDEKNEFNGTESGKLGTEILNEALLNDTAHSNVDILKGTSTSDGKLSVEASEASSVPVAEQISSPHSIAELRSGPSLVAGSSHSSKSSGYVGTDRISSFGSEASTTQLSSTITQWAPSAFTVRVTTAPPQTATDEEDKKPFEISRDDESHLHKEDLIATKINLFSTVINVANYNDSGVQGSDDYAVSLHTGFPITDFEQFDHRIEDAISTAGPLLTPFRAQAARTPQVDRTKPKISDTFEDSTPELESTVNNDNFWREASAVNSD